MIETLDITKTATKTRADSSTPQHALPIEERDDITVDELEKISLPFPAELYNGRIVYKMANPEHGIIQSRLSAFLENYLRQNRIGFVMSETHFRLWPDRPQQARVPDLAFIKKDRLPDDLRHYPAMAPDLAVEIISPDDNFLRVMNKVDEYLEQGTQLVWLVISDTREVLACTPENKQSVRHILTAPELLPGFELPVREIFEDLPVAASKRTE